MNGYLEYMSASREMLVARKAVLFATGLAHVAVLMWPSHRAYMGLKPGKGWFRLVGFLAIGVAMAVLVFEAARGNY